MIPIPNSVRVPVCIEQGSVYNFSPDKNVANHYYVVLNNNPKHDDEIYLVSFTSNKENVWRYINYHHLDKLTCVELNENECPFLPRPLDSCINCNLYRSYPLDKMIELIDGSNGSIYPKVNAEFLARVIHGVRISIMIGEEIKSAL